MHRPQKARIPHRVQSLATFLGIAAFSLTLAGSAFSQDDTNQSPAITPPKLQTSLASLFKNDATLQNLLDQSREAVISVDITAEGIVSGASIARSSGSPDLDALLLQHIHKAKFSPKTQNGVPVATQTMMPIRFSARTSATPAAETSSYWPEFVRYAPYPAQLLNYGRYFTVVMRIELDIEDNGLMRPAAVQTPELLSEDDDLQRTSDCAIPGGRANLINSWLPYSGTFVHGAELSGITDATGAPIALTKLSPLNDLSKPHRITSASAGTHIAKEFGYLPCAGTQVVRSGVRSDSFLPLHAQWQVQTNRGSVIPLRLANDAPLLPFVLVRYEEGAITPAPMRLVMAGIDWPARKAWLQLISTLPSEPKVRKVETRALDPATTSKQERLNALLRTELEACEIPRHPIEACALPTRLSLWVATSSKSAEAATIEKSQ